MAKKNFKKHEIINSRISLLFFYLPVLAGVLWLERFARYRYDLILRHWLPWLLPTLFGAATLTFIGLLFLWRRKKQENDRVFSLSFLMLLPLPLMAAFLLPWLADFMPGWQFFRLACELVFYASLGGFAAYIAYYKVGQSAAPMGGVLTVDILVLFYFYDRFLSPSSFILNTQEFGYLPDETVALILVALTAAVHLTLHVTTRKLQPALRPAEQFVPAALTALLLLLNAFLPLGITPIRWMIFGGMSAIGVWFWVWCLLKKKNIL